jgi:hypothetical protein
MPLHCLDPSHAPCYCQAHFLRSKFRQNYHYWPKLQFDSDESVLVAHPRTSKQVSSQSSFVTLPESVGEEIQMQREASEQRRKQPEKSGIQVL